ncbi:MAG: hypothetical protein R2788_11035 [Saprospiraceae bacterium]
MASFQLRLTEAASKLVDKLIGEALFVQPGPSTTATLNSQVAPLPSSSSIYEV